MGDLVIKATASNSLKIQSDNATNVLTVGTDDSVTLGTEFKVTSTSQTFTVKGIDAAITDSQTGVSPNVADSDSGQLAIYNGSTKLWGITEHGYILKPGNPSFHCSGDESTTFSAGASAKVTGWTIQHNIGSHFSGTTDTFTAPVPGIYLIYFGLLTNNANTRMESFIYKNGSNYAAFDGSPGSGNYDQCGGAVTMNLVAGDYIYIHNGDNDGQNNTGNFFGGYLLG